ncbi:MAG TPA: hypothetical protein VGR58_06730 [Candidatus Acidoferrum sp.]|nr:hypothetical protein [Candidatus Acidoferrum sp.]
MYEAMRQTLLRVNISLTGYLAEARRALRGECDFCVEDVRKIRGPVEEMAPVMAHSTELLRLQPELAGQLELYKSQLGDLQITLGQIRVMLLARQASLEAGRAQLSAVSQWMGAFRQTR